MEKSTVTKKALTLHGYSAVEYCTDVCGEGSLFTEEITLLFVLEGTLRFLFGKEEYTISQDQMAFLRKDILLQYSSGIQFDGTPLRYIKVCLKQDLMKEFVKLAELNSRTNDESLSVTVSQIDEQLSKFIDSLLVYFIEPEKVAGSLTKIKLLELLFCLVRFDRRVLSRLMDLRQQYRIDITSTVEENVMNSLSLRELAVLSGRSLSSFRRDFLAIYNMPPSQWIRQRRLEKARELLLSTTMTITDVCYTLGFENLPHFSRLFKSYFGRSPSGYKLTAQVA